MKNYLKKANVSFIHFVCILLLVNSCNQTKTSDTQKNILIMIDFSRSIKDDIEHYKNNIKKIINKLPEGAHIVIGKIQETTEATFVPIVNEKLQDYNFITDSDLDFENSIDSIKKRITKIIEENLSNSVFYKNTNIISSFKLVNTIFPDTGLKYFFIFSDMFHSYIDFNLEKQKIDDKFIEQTIEKLRNNNMLPDLRNVKVYIIGAKAKDDYQYNLVKKFWQRIFNECNAQLVHYSYSLLNVDF